MQQIFRRFFFILNLATLLCQSWCRKLIYREICVKRSAVGNKEMSALKYGIRYWAKIDRSVIASRHINTRSFNNKLGKKFWKHASNVVCGMRGGEEYVWIGKRPRNSKVSQLLSMIVVCLHLPYHARFSVKNQWIGTMTVCSLQGTCNDSGRK